MDPSIVCTQVVFRLPSVTHVSDIRAHYLKFAHELHEDKSCGVPRKSNLILGRFDKVSSCPAGMAGLVWSSRACAAQAQEFAAGHSPGMWEIAQLCFAGLVVARRGRASFVLQVSDWSRGWGWLRHLCFAVLVAARVVSWRAFGGLLLDAPTSNYVDMTSHRMVRKGLRV